MATKIAKVKKVMGKKTGAAPKMAAGASKGSPITDMIKDRLSDPDTQKAILGWLFGKIGGLFKKKKPAPPVAPVLVPTQADEDDDHIPAPPGTLNRRITEVRCNLFKVQLQRARFPEAYAEGKDGLVEGAALRDIESGHTAMNYGSKFWLDLTAYDYDGKEIRPDAVVALGLQYKTEHHAGDAFIVGAGGSPQDPSPYETNDTEKIGNGITAWITTLGFVHQFKAHGEGEFEAWGVVNGIKSNVLQLKVS